jgi:hypothetical protein
MNGWQDQSGPGVRWESSSLSSLVHSAIHVLWSLPVVSSSDGKLGVRSLFAKPNVPDNRLWLYENLPEQSQI